MIVYRAHYVETISYKFRLCKIVSTAVSTAKENYRKSNPKD